ncbi:MAG: hypothetical protein GXO78_14425 [Calditrichaeota bacterium]|nr:hypothetical protein [Calditrichota bacterium]
MGSKIKGNDLSIGGHLRFSRKGAFVSLKGLAGWTGKLPIVGSMRKIRSLQSILDIRRVSL